MGAAGLELLAAGDLAPQQLSQSARREIRHLFAGQQLAISAIEAPLRFGLDEPQHQEARLEYLRQAMTLSFDLGCRVVICPPGPIPKDENDPRLKTLRENLLALGQFGDRTGATVALQVGLDSAAAIDSLLSQFDTAGLAVAFNPGLALVHGHDPYEAARTLRSRIRLVHAGDARRGLSPRLVPVGRGDVDWLQMMATFAEIEYRGFVTIPVEPGPTADAEAAAGIAFLKRVTV